LNSFRINKIEMNYAKIISYKGFGVIDHLKWEIGQKLRRLTQSRKGIVLGRVACLGRDVFDLHPNGTKENLLINQQKMRVDLWLDLMKGAPRCDPALVKMYLKRKDIYPLIEEQKYTPWLKYVDADLLLMDSFSELTDQMFVHKKKGWAFCSHYTDIESSVQFTNEFECRGLLPIEKLYQAYNIFFDYFNRTHQNTQIIFLNFPASLDTREEFNKRADEIRLAMEAIAVRYSFIKAITIDHSDVVRASGDSFPYHFDQATKISFLKKWVQT
jgi:hypothetical protein